MAELRLKWLGPPEIEVDEQPLRLEMRKTLALLAYLSLCSQSPTRETLAAMFWPEYDQQHALSNLRRNLSSLSQDLPPGILETDREKIGLKKGSWLNVDVDEFLAYLVAHEKHDHPREEICPECLVHLEGAVSCYQGDFLEGFNLKSCPGFDEWQLFQRETLRAKYAWALEKLATCYAAQDQWEKAIFRVRAWLALDRLHEPAQRMLIRLLSQSGQRRTALRQYEDLKRILQDELGQKPEDETTALYEKIQGEGQEIRKITSKPLIVEPLPTHSLEPLLKTKLYIPFSKGKQVFREQLVSRLNQIQEKSLTILSAPAGFGKTTTLCEWIKQSPLLVGWLSLDDADNHLIRFLTYLIAALQDADVEIGADFLELLQSPQPISPQEIANSLIGELEKNFKPFVLVLDDYQLIQTKSVHEVLALLLDRLPENAHLVISTRSDPPLRLARLRARGKLLEIRIRDLRFNLEETQILLNDIMGLGILGEDANILEERTEGWAVGLQLAALSLQRSPDKSRTIQAFSGSNRYVLDYLLEEVFEHQPKFIQDFLLQTSILEQMNGPLCDVVTGVREWSTDNEQAGSLFKIPLSGQQILEYLERANLFVLSLDDERCWYRYHHIFAELLTARLKAISPDRIESLHQGASEWYEQNGNILAAVRHSLASKSYEYAAGVIERAVRANLIWSSGDLSLMLSWVDALPKEVLFANPLLRLYLCVALYVTGQFKKSYSILDELEDSLPGILKRVPNPVLVEQTFFAFRILHEATKGNISRAVDYFHRSVALIDGDERMNILSKNYLFMAYLTAGDVENALKLSLPSHETLVTHGYTLSAINNVKNIADIYILQGRLNEALKLCQEAIELCKLNELRSPIAGILAIPLGTVLFERNQLEVAEQYVQEGLDLLAKGPIRNDFGEGYALLAMIKQAQGDRKSASSLIGQALQLAEFGDIPRIIHLIKAYQARIWLAQGETDLASNWADDYSIMEPTEYPREVEDLTLAQLYILQKRYTEAIDLLDRLLLNARAARRDGRVIEILALQAAAFYLQNRIEEALDLLAESFRIAQGEGYIRVYLDKGKPMQDLLILFRNRLAGENTNFHPEGDESADYLSNLLSVFK